MAPRIFGRSKPIELQITYATEVDQQHCFVDKNPNTEMDADGNQLPDPEGVGALYVPDAEESTKLSLDETDNGLGDGSVDFVIFTADKHTDDSITYAKNHKDKDGKVVAAFSKVKVRDITKKKGSRFGKAVRFMTTSVWPVHALVTRDEQGNITHETKGAKLVPQAQEIHDKYKDKGMSSEFHKGKGNECYAANKDIFGNSTGYDVHVAKQVVLAVKRVYGLDITLKQAQKSLAKKNYVFKVDGKSYKITTVNLVKGQAANYCAGDTSKHTANDMKGVQVVHQNGRSSPIPDIVAEADGRAANDYKAQEVKCGIVIDDQGAEEVLSKAAIKRANALKKMGITATLRRSDPGGKLDKEALKAAREEPPFETGKGVEPAQGKRTASLGTPPASPTGLEVQTVDSLKLKQPDLDTIKRGSTHPVEKRSDSHVDALKAELAAAKGDKGVGGR